MKEKAIFHVPRDARPEQLETLFRHAGCRFVAAMDARGLGLRSDLYYYVDHVASLHDLNDRHYIIEGDFKPRFDPGMVVFEDVPTRVVEKLVDQYGREIKVL